MLDDIRNRIKAASPELSGRLAFDGNEDASGMGADGLVEEMVGAGAAEV